MNLFTPQEVIANYARAGAAKAAYPVWKLLLLGILAGILIAMACVVSSTAAHDATTVGGGRLITGVIFAFGLAMVVMTGAELFTGNCLLAISVLERQIRLRGMLRNWCFVYLGNFAGALLVAAACAYFGQLNYSANGLAVYTIRVAVAKSSLSFGTALVFGFFCNLLVCVGVFIALSSHDVTGRLLGAILPVAYFVSAGFDHCVADMYYVPAGLFALSVPAYAAKAVELGVNTSALTWTNCLLANLLPVTLGNIAGGAGFASLMWVCHRAKSPPYNS
jgi:formate/nitrite transporter